MSGYKNSITDINGNVGIGTDSPGYKLHVNGGDAQIANGSTGTLYMNNANNYLYGDANGVGIIGAGDNFRIKTNAAERMRITSGGAFFLYDIIGFSGTNSDMRYDSASGQVYYLTSSARYKSDITTLENSLNKVNDLRPVRFKDNYTETYTTGLIAEEVVKVIPEVVFNKEVEGFDSPQVEGVNYSDLVPFLIKSIQELKAEIDILKAK